MIVNFLLCVIYVPYPGNKCQKLCGQMRGIGWLIGSYVKHVIICCGLGEMKLLKIEVWDLVLHPIRERVHHIISYQTRNRIRLGCLTNDDMLYAAIDQTRIMSDDATTKT